MIGLLCGDIVRRKKAKTKLHPRYGASSGPVAVLDTAILLLLGPPLGADRAIECQTNSPRLWLDNQLVVGETGL